MKDNGNDNVEIFGRGINPINKKEEALLPYMFSLVIENTYSGHYWSEKVTDAFLCGTVPIYVGASNISEYFPRDSFIDASGLTPEDLAVTIKRLDPTEYFKRIEALREARDVCLFEQNLPSALAKFIEKSPPGSSLRFHSTADSNSLVHWFLKVVSPLLRLGAETKHRFLKSK
jgi:hypothetical protein